MKHVSDRHLFSELAPAAPLVFSYVAAHPEIRKFAVQFEYAVIDPTSARAVVKFGGNNCAERKQATIWVSAYTKTDGTWSITHSIGSIS